MFKSRTIAFSGFVCLVCAAVLLRSNAIASMAITNIAMLMFHESVFHENILAQIDYPITEILQQDARAKQGVSLLKKAVVWDNRNWVARWALGRLLLAAGQYRAAADTLKSLTKELDRNPLFYLDTITALSRSDDHTEVITLYRSAKSRPQAQVVFDSVAWAYIKVAQETDDAEQRRALLLEAKALHPSDLCINFWLWDNAQRNGDDALAAVYFQQLVFFRVNSLNISDNRLFDCALNVIPALFKYGIWDHEKTLNVISFIVQTKNDALEAERFLSNMIKGYPDEPAWYYYLGELYHRRGELRDAEIAYRKALDGGYALPQKSQFIALTQRQNRRFLLADLLGVSESEIELGVNLIEKGDFEIWNAGPPIQWRFVIFVDGPYNDGEFVSVQDTLEACEGRSSARIIGFWTGTDSKRFLAHVGLQQVDMDGAPRNIVLAPNSLYLLSFCYRTEDTRDKLAGVYVSANPNVLFMNTLFLPGTHNQWKVVLILAANQESTPQEIRPLLLNWGAGSVWFDAVELRQVRHVSGLENMLKRLPIIAVF